jgi:hypothetical protein
MIQAKSNFQELKVFEKKRIHRERKKGEREKKPFQEDRGAEQCV